MYESSYDFIEATPQPSHPPGFPPAPVHMLNHPTNTTMAVPFITSLSDCANYAKTLQPYLPQLSALPQQLASAIKNPQALKQLYLTTNPAITGLAFTLTTFPIFLIVSEINRNYSQVDRVWSILPTIYNAHYAVWARLNGLPTRRLDHVLAFSVVWTLRLTYNYWRKGGYQVGSEDYRWLIIKKKIGQPAFFLLNLLFVSSLQIVSLLVLSLAPLLRHHAKGVSDEKRGMRGNMYGAYSR